MSGGIWGGSRLKATGKWDGEVGGGAEKRAGKTGSVSSGRGRGGEVSQSLLNGTGGGSGFTPWGKLHCLAPPLPAPERKGSILARTWRKMRVTAPLGREWTIPGMVGG